MYLGSWKIDDYLTFCVNTHDPTTGAATDADAPPSYRIYEDETAIPILTGNMALFDSVNTAGFYSERVQLTVASGFEQGKTYTIYVSASVGGVEGTISRNFQIRSEINMTFIAGAIQFTYTVTNSLTLLPLEGVEVWISTDIGGVNIVWKGETDMFGVARDFNGVLPNLDPGTYYFWRKKAGFSFVEPDTEIVS